MDEEVRLAADISPAIKELKRIHLALVDSVQGRAYNNCLNARDTVISVVPGERRAEPGWYKWRAWESKTEEMLHELDPTHRPQRYHETFIAGEALNKPLDEIVLLMMHQVCHQYANVVSDRTYHSKWLPLYMYDLFHVEEEAISRVDNLGWVEVDKTKVGPRARKLIDHIVKGIDPVSFDLWRTGHVKTNSSQGKMYLWKCDCGAPSMRTGGRPRLTCDLCGGKLKFRDAAKVSLEWLLQIPEEYRA